MVRLKKIGVLSAAKTAALVYGAFGLLFAPLFLLVGITATATLPANQRLFGGFYLVFAIVMPFVYAAFGFIGGAFVAWFYNLITRKFDAGLEFELDQLPMSPLHAAPTTL